MRLQLRLILTVVASMTLAGCQGAPPAPRPPTGTLDFRSPTGSVWTNGAFDVAIEAKDFMPSQVQLVVDGQTVQTLLPPFQAHVDTKTWAEGDHALVGRAQSAGQDVSTPPRLISVDRTPPSLVVTSPVNGASASSPGTVVSMTFDEPVLLGDAGTIQLYAAGVPVPFSAVQLNDSVHLTPELIAEAPKPYPMNATLSVGGVVDRAGNPVHAYQWSWTIPFWLQLGAEVSAVPGTGVLGFADLVATPDGGLLVSVTQTFQDGLRGALMAWNGSNWEPYGTPVPAIGGVSQIYSFAVDTPGLPWITLPSADPANSALDLLTTMRWSGTEWTEQGQAFRPGNLQPLQMRPTLAPSGEMWLLATGMTLNPVQSWFAHRWNGSSWSQVGGQVNDAGGWGNAGVLRVDADGVAYVATTERRFSSAGVHVHVLDGGMWWPLGGELDFNGDSASGSKDLAMELDPDGRPVVLMDQHSYRGYDSFLWHWDGATWQTVGDGPIGEADVGSTPLGTGTLILAPDGTPTVVLQRLVNGDAGIVVREFGSAGWRQLGEILSAPPGRILAGTAGTNYVGYVRAVHDGAGRRVLLFLWCGGNGCNPVVFRENR